MYEESALLCRALFCFADLSWLGRGYPGGCSVKYISDFSNISTITPNISAIISIYRRFDKGYRLINKLRQKKFFIYPATFYMKGDRLEVRQRYWQIHWWIQLKKDLRISCWTFWQIPALPTNPQTGKSKVSHMKKDNLLLFLTMRVQCKIARKDEKYLQDYCVRIA